MREVEREAKRHKIKLLVLPTTEAIKALKQAPKDTNAILHVTCGGDILEDAWDSGFVWR
jgi:hypothetical protein